MDIKLWFMYGNISYPWEANKYFYLFNISRPGVF